MKSLMYLYFYFIYVLNIIVVDIVKRVKILKWRQTTYLAKRIDKRWTKSAIMVLERISTGRRVGRKENG